MKLIINLANRSKWISEISDDYSESEQEIQLNIDLLPVSQIQEPYLVLTDHNEVNKVKESIIKQGFLHPILVFNIQGEYILADGSHRLEAMRQLNVSLIPSIVIDSSVEFDSWVKLIGVKKSKIPPYKSIYKVISPTQRKNLIHQEFDLVSIDSLIEYQNDPKIIAVYSDGKTVHVFSNKDPQNRVEHLKLTKQIDDILNTEDKEYTIISKSEEEQFNYHKYLLIPAPEGLGDLNILVRNKELRRPKAFRVKIPIRLVHLSIDGIEYLNKPKDQALNELQDYFNKNLNEFVTIFPKLSFSKLLDISWYYHILLVGSKTSFLQDVETNEKEKDQLDLLCDSLTVLDTEILEIITQN